MTRSRIMAVDFETQSSCNIVNPLYVSHEETHALCMSYGFIEQGVKPRLWQCPGIAGVPHIPLDQDIIDHAKNGGVFAASNAAFDFAIWNNIAVRDHGFPPTTQDQWICTQAQSRVAGLPSALDKAAQALQLKYRKDRRGSELIKRCCMVPYSTDPKDYLALGEYCLQDWVVMARVAMMIPGLSELNIEDYHLNERINQRGIRIDYDLAAAATEYADREREEIAEKLHEVTCEAVEKPTQHRRFCTWLRECLEDDEATDAIELMKRYKKGELKWSSDKNVRANLIAGHTEGSFTLAPDIVDALNLMDDAGGSATSKFKRMTQRAHPDDDRVRGVLRYAGAASTLRYSSMGLQIHNFRRDAFDEDEAEHYRSLLVNDQPLVSPTGEDVRVMDVLGRLLRSAIIPQEGHVFVVGDWSAVESRMTAWVSGDENKLNVFRRGEDPYCYAASSIYGRTITPEDKAERQIGKVTDLAAGFLGGPGALAAMAAAYRVYVAPEDRKRIIDAYRAAHPRIVAYGDALMDTIRRAITLPDTWHSVRSVSYRYSLSDHALYCRLSDGQTTLRYPDVRIEMKPAPWDEEEMIPQVTALKAAFTAAAEDKEWPRHGLWRGLVLENIVQANCAINLRECLYELEYFDELPVVFHVHDEIILEVPEDRAEHALKALTNVMNTPPDWAEDLPLIAEPQIMTRYGK